MGRGILSSVKDEEMTTEKLSNLSKVTLLAVTALDPDPGHADFRGCIPNPCTAKECGQLQPCSETAASLRLLYFLFVFQNGLFFFLIEKKMYLEFFESYEHNKHFPS